MSDKQRVLFASGNLAADLALYQGAFSDGKQPSALTALKTALSEKQPSLEIERRRERLMETFSDAKP